LRIIAAVSAGSFVVGSLGLVAAWTSWRAARNEFTGSEGPTAAGLRERKRFQFLALAGVLGSSIFSLGLLLTAVAALVVSPCAKW
jgi:hypothetical protein